MPALPHLRLLALFALLAVPVRAEPLETTVRQVTREAVYVEAGSADGLRPGQTGRVMRDGLEVARLEIQFLAASRASCRVIDGEPALVSGDLVIFEVDAPTAAAEIDAPANGPDEPAASPPSPRDAPEPEGEIRWNARLIADVRREQGEETWLEPDQRLFVEAAGLPLASRFRLRARRDGSSRAGRDAEQRVDELSLDGQAGALDWRAGRFHSRSFSLLGALDGAEAGLRPVDLLRVGLLVGRDADPDSSARGTGAGLQADLGRPGGSWGLGAAGMRLRQSGRDRDRVLACGFWRPGERVALRQELRLDREEGGEGWTLTHALGRLQWPLSSGWGLEAGLRLGRTLRPVGPTSAADSLFDRPATREASLRLRGRMMGGRITGRASLRGPRHDGNAARRLEGDASWPAFRSTWSPAPRCGLAWQQADGNDSWRLRAGLRWQLPLSTTLDLTAGRLAMATDGDPTETLDWLRTGLDGRIGRHVGWGLEAEWERGTERLLRRQALRLTWRL